MGCAGQPPVTAASTSSVYLISMAQINAGYLSGRGYLGWSDPICQGARLPAGTVHPAPSGWTPVVRRPRPGPSQEDKLEALRYQLVEAVADLATSDGWAWMLAAAARFHAYTGGGVGMFRSPGMPSGDAVPRVVGHLGRYGQAGQSCC